MQSQLIRQKFIAFFQSKLHHVVPSAPMVVKNDPTLMFTNAGMNQFKDVFLNNAPIITPRVVDTQKCLRVSGKHNDLEEVGHDTYHHTMFEMLGNWSFGDYFKDEAISWAFELLTEVYRIPKDRLYATVFEGCAKDNLTADDESTNFWLRYLPKEHIIKGSAKDNFWEMGESGPCGPCTEIHIDLRNDSDRKKINGAELVNKGLPTVIELWNLVFMQYNRKINGELETLPHKHVDTGMGFERLCMVLQNKQSNYDTDIFSPIIHSVEKISGFKYTHNHQVSVAMRVIADHIRAIAFAIADGQLPSNVRAGYVIRRILRRAVRYGYTFLNCKEPFLYKLVNVLVIQMGEVFPELVKQQVLIENVINQEEKTFFQTLENGIRLLNLTINQYKEQGKKIIDGHTIFLLYDTYGFPIDLTDLMAQEEGFTIDKKEFEVELNKQKNRSRQDAETQFNEWIILSTEQETVFQGYDTFLLETKIIKYRKIERKQQSYYQIVLAQTPFYAEGGGQIGDTGWLRFGDENISVINTVRENGVIVHLTQQLPQNPQQLLKAEINLGNREKISANHTATHLLHYTLRKVLGEHVEQKGSLVTATELRFDFSHFQKVTITELQEIQKVVNSLIRKNETCIENRNTRLEDALSGGAIALFGEKYTENVRTIRFGDSFELCGGAHTKSTGNIGYFKIISESSIATGIRRIVATTGYAAELVVEEEGTTLKNIKQILKAGNNTEMVVTKLIEENETLRKTIQAQEELNEVQLIKSINENAITVGDVKIFVVKPNLSINSSNSLRNIGLRLIATQEKVLFSAIADIEDKVFLAVGLSQTLLKQVDFNAKTLIEQYAPLIEGKGGGQPHFAMAGGKNRKQSDEILQNILSLLS